MKMSNLSVRIFKPLRSFHSLKKRHLRVFHVIILVLAIPLTIILVQQAQDIRQLAAESTNTFTPTAIPISAAEIPNPMRGGYPSWGIMNPSDWPTTDSYERAYWSSIETSQGVYNWSWFETRLANAKAHGGKFGFRIEAADSSQGGNQAVVPQYLVAGMAKGFWFTYPGNNFKTYAPDWNDPFFLSRAQALLTAIANKYGNDPRLGWVEIGFYGDWSEWHVWQYPYSGTSYGPSPTGASDMTVANKQALVQMTVNTFPTKQIIMPIDEQGMISWVMQNYPNVGLRRDCIGFPDFINQQQQPYLSSFQDRWKTEPWITESCYMSSGTNEFSTLATQVSQYHIAMVSGHNMQSYSSLSSTEQATLQQAYKSTGYRFVLNSLTIPSTITPGNPFNVTTNWSNVGSTPAYTPWNVLIQLRNSANTIVWQGTASLNFRQLLPTGSTPQTVSDTFSVPSSISPGDYSVSIQAVDPDNYYLPLNLAIQGRQSDGSYSLGTIHVGSTPPTNTPTPTPTVSPTTMPTIVPTGSSTNLIQNGTFDANPWLTSWNFKVAGGKASINQEAGSGYSDAQITVTQSTTSPWNVQLTQPYIPVVTKSYQLTFWAKASTNRSIVIILQKNYSPYSEYLRSTLNITTAWQPYTVTFTQPVADANTLLSFNLSTSTGTVWLDTVSLK